MRYRNYRNILKPAVEFLMGLDKLLLDTREMAGFLGVGRKTVQQLVATDRIPLPVSLGLGECHRWSVIELLEWIEAGCPGRTAWIAARGRSGWSPYWRTRP